MSEEQKLQNNLLHKYAKQLAFKILHERHRQGLKQSDFGKKVGLPQTVISYLERGNGNPTLSQILKLAQFFKLPLSKIFECTQDLIEVYDVSRSPDTVESPKQPISQLPLDIEITWHEVKREQIKTIQTASSRQAIVCVSTGEVYVRVRSINQMHAVKENQFAIVPGGYELDLIGYWELTNNQTDPIGTAKVIIIECHRKEGR
jgi:transcriptional regulator with XRE-family HTH domain